MARPRPPCCIALPLARDLRERIEAETEPTWVRPGAADELASALIHAEGLLVSNQVVVDDALLRSAPRLRVVAGFGVGYDRFDVASATKRGVAVCNTPDVVTEPVVNLTIGLLIALSRRLLENSRYALGGAWSRREAPPAAGVELRGKTLGIVGLGRIGRRVAERALPFGLRVVFHDVFDTAPPDAPPVPFRSLADLLAESDFVSLHTDLNPSSHHLIGERELAAMKPTAWLVNTSRGGVVDQRALSAALREGRIAGAALDVLEQEPPDQDDPLLGLPNLLALPHIGTATVETRQAMAKLCVENLLAVLRGDPPPACVNPEVLAQLSRAKRAP
jgi:glyoxylate reductase